MIDIYFYIFIVYSLVVAIGVGSFLFFYSKKFCKDYDLKNAGKQLDHRGNVVNEKND